jgi:hypothetical protein
MLNIHIGLPGLLTDLLRSVGESTALSSREDLLIVPPKLAKSVLAPLVSPRKVVDSEATERLSRFLNPSDVNSCTTISVPNLFGYASDVLRSRRPFPLADGRIASLSKLIEAGEARFHLTLINQIDYILRLPGMSADDQIRAIQHTKFSWAELVHRVRMAAPEIELLVWDFSQPKKVALPFIESMIDSIGLDLIPQILRGLIADMSVVGSGPFDYTQPRQVAAIVWLDERYSLDLDAIETMDDVTLFRPESVPTDLHI